MNSPSAIKNKKIGILGGKGFLGSNLCEHFSAVAKVDSITRDSYQSKKGSYYDILINANGNSRRFWANENPLEDFEASTESVYKSLFDFKFQKYIYISSPDIYIDPSGPTTTKEDMVTPGVRNTYGLNKFLSEQIVTNYSDSYIIIRPSAILGNGLKKGPVFDILDNKPLFITQESYIQFITANAIAECVTTFLDKGIKNEIFNVAGSGHTKVSELGDISGREVKFSSDAVLQKYEMNTEKVNSFYPLKTSDEYVRDYLNSEDSK